MKTSHIFSVILLMFANANLMSQNGLTLDECQQKARDNYPLIKQFDLLEKSKEYTLSNLSKNYLPQVSLNAQATYQSEVTGIPISLPGVDIPSLDKDQYKATIDVSQTIWDGGNISAQHKIAHANNDVEKQSAEVNLYAIRERVNQLYFGALTINEQLKQLDILEENLRSSLKMAEALLRNGAGTQSDVDAVNVELLNVKQNRTGLIASKTAFSEMLSTMIGLEITEQTTFEKPSEIVINPNAEIRRPEIDLFTKQRSLFEAQESNISAKNMPKFSLFAQGGYGKPGLNMLSNGFDFFGIGGIRMTWNFGNLYTKSNEKRLINNNKNLISNQEEVFLFNTNLQLDKSLNEIKKSKKMMSDDDEIITLRGRIKKASESKYENGVYTINDLIRDINQESQSRQAKILHEIEYLMNVYQYNDIRGNP